MNFEDLTSQELDEHMMQRLVFDDEELSPILKGHIFIEKVLETLISRNLVAPKVFFKSTRSFDLKIDLSFAMGLIDEKYYSAFKAINKVRNNYAHKHDYKVSLEELNGFKFDWEDIQNKAYAKASSKSIEDSARIATIFLCWKALLLIGKDEE
ncbi:hypothetical protein [Klebsiella pneumoniae]|uniref:hypothetical protein n=1 Tax=Klebsiella pneumoniae TaxID=573 RepID=UPI0037503DED